MDLQNNSLSMKIKTYGQNSSWQHFFFVVALFLVSLLYFHSLITTTHTLNNIHYLDNLAFLSHSIEQAISKYGEFPLWNPYTFGGIPLIGIPEHAMLDINILVLLLSREVYLSMNIAIILYFFIAGLGMYLLAFSFTNNKLAAFISALLFMFNGFMHSFIKGGHINLLESYSLIPFIIFFAHLSLSKDNPPLYAFFAGLFLSLQVFAGGVIFLLYTIILLSIFFLAHLATRFSPETIKRLLLSGTFIGIIAFGISAVKLLPTLEFTAQSNRAEGVSYQEYLGYPVDVGNWWGVFVFNHSFHDVNAAVGIAGTILMLLGLFSFRKRYVVFCIVVALLSMLLASGSFIAQFFYDFIPGFGKMRHIERALVLFAFAAPLLAGFGAKNLFSNVEKHYFKWVKAVFGIILLLISADLVFFQPFPQTIEATQPEDIGLLKVIEQDQDTFRIINLGLKEFIGSSGYVYYMQEGIGDVKGGGGIWPSDYPEFLYLARQSNPSKLWGLLNVKYIITDTEIAIPNTVHVGTFNTCPECIIPVAFGPHVYRNLDFLPRAYAVEDTILMIGDPKNVKDLIYFLLLNSRSKAIVLVQGKSSPNDHTLDELKRHSAVILATSNVDQQSMGMLQAYARAGGRIFPDIFRGENSLSQEVLARVFNLTTEDIQAVPIVRHSFHTVELDVRNASGILVMSERYAFYPGWKAYGDGVELEVLKIDNYISGVYLDTYQTITWHYQSTSFSHGLFITFTTLLISIGFVAFVTIRKRKAANSRQNEEG
jgi:hypothetical protein